MDTNSEFIREDSCSFVDDLLRLLCVHLRVKTCAALVGGKEPRPQAGKPQRCAVLARFAQRAQVEGRRACTPDR